MLWRERRTPPFMQVACALAAVIGLSGVAAQNVIVTPLAVLAAVAIVLVGRRVAAGHYLEDQVLTDRRALVVPREGAAYGFDLDDIQSVEMRGSEGLLQLRRAPVALRLRAASARIPPGAARRARRTSRSSSDGIPTAPGEGCAGSRAVRADGDRGTHRGLRAPRSGRGRRPAPLRRRRALRLGDGAAGRCRSGGRHRSRRVRGLSRTAAARRRATPCSSAPGNDGVPTTADRAALLALLDPLRDRRDIVLVDARGSGRSGRVGDRRDAYGAGAAAADLDAVRAELGVGHVELYAAGDGGRIALAYAARYADRLRALVLDGGPRATLLRRRRPRRGARARQGARPGSGASSSAWPRGCASTRCTRTGGSTTTCSPAWSLAATPGRWRSCRPPPRQPCTATPCRSRGSSRLRRPRRRARPLRRRPPPATTTLRPPRPPTVDGGPFTGATWLRALGLAACKSWPAPAAPDPVLPAGAALTAAPALVLGGELDVGAADGDAAQGRRPAAVRQVRARARRRRAACAERSGRVCGDARARLPADARAREPGLREPSCAAARSCAPSRSGWQPPRPPCATRTRTAATARRSPTGARPPPRRSASPTRSRAPRRAGAPTRVTGLRGGSRS